MGLIKIRSSKNLKAILDKDPRCKREENIRFYLKGIYDTRFLGIVIYRINNTINFDNEERNT